MTAPDQECFTDFALQEYAQARLDPNVRAEVETHTGSCAECRSTLQAFAAEAALLRAVFTETSAAGSHPDISDERLALYSGGALPSADAEQVESILSRNPGLLRRLRAISQETASVREAQTENQPVAKPQPARKILRMPKRISQPNTITLTRKASGGEQA